MYFEYKKRGWWVVLFFPSHRNVSQTLVTFSHYWLIIITISSSQHVLIQTELRRRMREDRHVPAGCRLSSSKHWGAGPQQKRMRKRTVRFEGLPTEHPPMFCMCSGICINNLWEHLVLIPFLLISCWMSNGWKKALVYIGIAIATELGWSLTWEVNKNGKTCFILSDREFLLLYLFSLNKWAMIYSMLNT